jgi:hypothetical protein
VLVGGAFLYFFLLKAEMTAPFVMSIICSDGLPDQLIECEHLKFADASAESTICGQPLIRKEPLRIL